MSDDAMGDRAVEVNVEAGSGEALSEGDKSVAQQMLESYQSIDPEALDPENIPDEDEEIEKEAAKAEKKEEAPAEPSLQAAPVEVPVEDPEAAEAAPQLPEWVKDLKVVDENTVELDGKKFNKDLAEDMINHREHLSTKEWIQKPVSEMDEEHARHYKAFQSIHDRHKSQQQTISQPGQADPYEFYKKQSQEVLSELINTEEGQRVLQAIKQSEQMQSIQPEAQPKQEDTPAYTEQINKLVAEYDDGKIDRDEFIKRSNKLNEEVQSKTVSTVQSTLDEKVEQIVERTFARRQQEAAVERIKQESLELFQADDRFASLAVENIGPDGLSPIGRLIKHGHPITGEPMTPKSAFQYILAQDRGSEGRISLDMLKAQPRNSGKNSEPTAITDEVRKTKTAHEIAIQFAEEQGF